MAERSACMLLSEVLKWVGVAVMGDGPGARGQSCVCESEDASLSNELLSDSYQACTLQWHALRIPSPAANTPTLEHLSGGACRCS